MIPSTLPANSVCLREYFKKQTEHLEAKHRENTKFGEEFVPFGW